MDGMGGTHHSTTSQIVIFGPRPVVSELVHVLEAEEFGRSPGSSPLPIDTTLASASDQSGVAQCQPQLADLVVGPVLEALAADVLEARYTVVAGAGLARSVRELASVVPEATIVLTEQSRHDLTHLTLYRSGSRVAHVDFGCNGLLVLPSRAGVTLHDCMALADRHALATAKLQAFVLLDDVLSNAGAACDPGAWHAHSVDCIDGTKLTAAHPDPERWVAQMILSNPGALGALLALPRGDDSPLDFLSVVVDDLLPYGLVGRDERQLRDIAQLACAWSAGRAIDAEVEHAIDQLCQQIPVRAIAEAALGSEVDQRACRAVDRVLERLARHRPVLHLVSIAS